MAVTLMKGYSFLKKKSGPYFNGLLISDSTPKGLFYFKLLHKIRLLGVGSIYTSN